MNYELRMREFHPVFRSLPLFYTTTIFVTRRLLKKDSKKTPIDIAFSSFLRENEISKMVDSVREKIDHYIQHINLHKKNIAGFSLKTHQWIMGSYIISRLKEMNPDIRILIGGIINEEQARVFMNVFNPADYAIWGEGEIPLVRLSRALHEKNDLRDVPNLAYRDGDRICSTFPNSEYPSLDSYPYADHSDFFSTLNHVGFKPQLTLPIWGSRSCPWNQCKFCVENEEYTYRVRSPKNIVGEIEFQAKKYGINSFFFLDTELPGNRERFKILLKLLVQLSNKSGEPYSYFGETSPVFIDAETVKYMNAAHFVSLQMGFEATSDKLLEKMLKVHRFAHNIQALKICSQYRLKVSGVNIIRGIPTETEEDILESCENVRFLRFLLREHTLNAIDFVLFKGSAFYEEMTKKERKTWNFHRLWEEIESLGLIPYSHRFEVSSFFKDRKYHHLWDDFDMAIEFFLQNPCSYKWIAYSNGSMIIEDGPMARKYKLSSNETDLLTFCDIVRSLSELKKRFHDLCEEEILKMLNDLQTIGLLYYDRHFKTIISVLEAHKQVYV
jgi:radical SAM superfamily enzyme YgiQ (UPF0313 family)